MSVRNATYYDLLQVSRTARPEGVRAAYRRLAQRYHPDKMAGNADAQRVMAALNEAYDVLSDPHRRAKYDLAIAEAASQRRRARQQMMARLDDSGAAWPWYLLFATVVFVVAAIGIAVYKNHVPGAPVVAPSARHPTALPAQRPSSRSATKPAARCRMGGFACRAFTHILASTINGDSSWTFAARSPS